MVARDKAIPTAIGTNDDLVFAIVFNFYVVLNKNNKFFLQFNAVIFKPIPVSEHLNSR